ncbi:hypothetical protein HZB01_04150 [Candidatus Woesearchaeota archaeon]|nr:hypothetical protein [Candidatus Woesearchaeota archaeon]
MGSLIPATIIIVKIVVVITAVSFHGNLPPGTLPSLWATCPGGIRNTAI